jgi:predicted Zn-dependent protease
MAGAIVGAVIGGRDNGASGSALGMGLAVAGNTLILSFGRTQEYEADRVGMILAARAGYDPRAAVGVWQRMGEQARSRGRAPEFLSTHPSEASRIREIEAHLPEALSYYQPR